MLLSTHFPVHHRKIFFTGKGLMTSPKYGIEKKPTKDQKEQHVPMHYITTGRQFQLLPVNCALTPKKVHFKSPN